MHAHRSRSPLLAPCLAAGAILLAHPAFAAEAAGTTVDLSGIAGTIVAGIGAAVLWLARAAVAAAVGYIQQTTKLELDEHTRDYLDRALQRAVDYAETKVGQSVGPAASEVDLHNATVAHAVNYVVDRVPDALAHFGITTEGLTAMVEARMMTVFGPAAGAPVGG